MLNMLDILRGPRSFSLPRWSLRVPRFSIPFDQDDALKVLAVVLTSLLLWWAAIALGVAVWLFLTFSGLR